jgi:hypothetical protein
MGFGQSTNPFGPGSISIWALSVPAFVMMDADRIQRIHALVRARGAILPKKLSFR